MKELRLFLEENCARHTKLLAVKELLTIISAFIKGGNCEPLSDFLWTTKKTTDTERDKRRTEKTKTKNKNRTKHSKTKRTNEIKKGMKWWKKQKKEGKNENKRDERERAHEDMPKTVMAECQVAMYFVSCR